MLFSSIDFYSSNHLFFQNRNVEEKVITKPEFQRNAILRRADCIDYYCDCLKLWT